MKISRWILGVILLAGAWLAGYGYGRWYGPKSVTQLKETQAPGYHCPMHPNFRSDKPGTCGICGMNLVPDEPQKQIETQSSDGASAEALPPGTIYVSPEKQQLIGVRFGTVEGVSATREFRAVGKVAPDETRIAKIQARIDGWVDKVYVDFTGKMVRKGQPLMTLYSPEMLASQQEYLLALRSREVFQSSGLVEAARKRLELFDLSEDQIREIEHTGKPMRDITLHSPIEGFVTVRNAFPKQRITPETELYTVVDLSRVWIMADVFESEASQIRLGMPVRIRTSYAGGETLAARVAYIQPEIDAMTRTLKVRLEADNPAMRLRLEMFVDVDFRTAGSARLSVPTEAVLDTGMRKTVFVDRGNGHLEPRNVTTGERLGERVEILQGLMAGERVVTSGNFLIDSESQLRSAAAGASGSQQSQHPAAQKTASGAHQHD